MEHVFDDLEFEGGKLGFYGGWGVEEVEGAGTHEGLEGGFGEGVDGGEVVLEVGEGGGRGDGGEDGG